MVMFFFSIVPHVKWSAQSDQNIVALKWLRWSVGGYRLLHGRAVVRMSCRAYWLFFPSESDVPRHWFPEIRGTQIFHVIYLFIAFWTVVALDLFNYNLGNGREDSESLLHMIISRLKVPCNGSIFIVSCIHVSEMQTNSCSFLNEKKIKSHTIAVWQPAVIQCRHLRSSVSHSGPQWQD